MGDEGGHLREGGEGRERGSLISTKLPNMQCLSSHVPTSPPHTSTSFSPSHLHIPHTLTPSHPHTHTPTFRYGYFFISVKWKRYVLYLSIILPAVSLVGCGRVGGVTGGEGGLLKVSMLTWIRTAECVSASFTVRSRLEANTLVGSWPHVVTRTRL